MIQNERRAIVENICDHHAGNDAEDDEPLDAERHALLRAPNAIIGEHADPHQHEQGKRVFQE